MASKFFEHFLRIAQAMSGIGHDPSISGTRTDGFFSAHVVEPEQPGFFPLMVIVARGDDIFTEQLIHDIST